MLCIVNKLRKLIYNIHLLFYEIWIRIIKMKIIVARFFLILALVITSINVCFPIELDCSDSTSSFSSRSINVNTANSDSESQESHHCAGLSCNTWIINFSNIVVKLNYSIDSQYPFSYNLIRYPKVSLSMDKPPLV